MFHSVTDLRPDHFTASVNPVFPERVTFAFQVHNEGDMYAYRRGKWGNREETKSDNKTGNNLNKM
jgi:hypothetical protein